MHMIRLSIRVLLNPTNREILAERGDILLDRMREEGVHIEALWGGKGVCGNGRVILERGRVEKRSTTPDKLLSEEELSAGYHLACMVRLVEDCEFTIPAESRVDSPKILMNASLELPERSPAASKHLLASPGGPAGSPLLAYRRLRPRDYQGAAPRGSDQLYEALNRMREGEVTVTVSRTSGYPEVIMAA